MEEALEMVRWKDSKSRMAGVERLGQLLEASRKSLSADEARSLVECSMDLLKDSNFRVAEGALQVLAAAAVLSGEHFKLYLDTLVPATVERLGDGKQPVRDAARRLLITLMEVSSPTIIVERAGSNAWTHKNWQVREEFARTVANALGLFAATEFTLQRILLPHVLQLMSDTNPSVREAATLCIEEMYTQFGLQFCDELQHQNIPLSLIKDINSRLEKIEPKARSSNGHGSHFIPTEMISLNASQKRSSSRTKSFMRETSVLGGETDVTEKPVDPIKVYSEKELNREFEKIASTLVPEKDWSVRIAAMQRVEGLVLGGAVDYPSFPMLLKQLVTPLTIQLSDRRSSIVKQGCHLLNFLSKELLGNFAACAEIFIPVLFKLVVITVLVIAESADNCIKTMLRNCKVARILPRIADCAKNDKNAVLRARCCEYALLILEYWADAPEIQRSADLYEDLVKCCVADAMSEVRTTARSCFRMFIKTWPERSRRVFLSFDPAIQRIINEEGGAMHQKYASPLRERGVQTARASPRASASNAPGDGTSAIVAIEKSAAIVPRTSPSSGGLRLSQTMPSGSASERSLESVLHASKEKVSAIESLLRSVHVSEKQSLSNTFSNGLDLGIETPSARDPPFPPAVPSAYHLTLQNSTLSDRATSVFAKGGVRNGGSNLTDLIAPQIQATRDSTKLSYLNHLPPDAATALSLPYLAKRASERYQEGAKENNTDNWSSRQFPNVQVEKQFLDTLYKDAGYRDPQGNSIPNFQRPLLRKLVAGRVSAGGRNIFDDSHFPAGEITSFMDGPASLNDALAEGLSPSSDWVARVSAFSFLRALLLQGPKGIQEVLQSFEKVMKLFFQHLDDPHHKVAQAAFSTLAEIIPACRKPIESYLERVLPHVFSRLIDPKELVRQPCSTTLEIIGKNYGIESLLPAILRSLDEQRSPKAKLAVIEFANSSFNKHVGNAENYSNNGFLKHWLAKLVPLVNDKNSKLKEAAIYGIISVYTHFDSASVLNFILSLSVEKQNSVRRALKQYTPRIEVDLVNFVQNKKERQRSKCYDPSEAAVTYYEEGNGGTTKQSHFFGRYSGYVDNEGVRKWSSTKESSQSVGHSISGEAQLHDNPHSGARSDIESFARRSKDMNYSGHAAAEGTGSLVHNQEKADYSMELETSTTPRLDINGLMNSDGQRAVGLNLGGESVNDTECRNEILTSFKNSNHPDSRPSIPQLLHQICGGNDVNSSLKKHEPLSQLIEISKANEQSIWSKYFNQIFTAILEIFDDPDSSIRELVLCLIAEMLSHQKEAMEDSIEIATEKLLQATQDVAAKVSNEAHRCLTILFTQYDPLRCLTVVVPVLVSDNEKTLVASINCLAKLVDRLSPEELMTQLPSFLPPLFDAFGNQSPDVRKSVVFCLVDIYIMLGKAFLPYLEHLNSAQLRLVTIYANRISQARSGAVIDAKHA